MFKTSSMKVINNNETLVNTNALTNDDTSYYAILDEQSNCTVAPATLTSETLLQRIQRGIGFEIDPEGLTHYYLPSVRLSSGKRKNKVAKPEVKKPKQRFFFKPTTRKYDLSFDIEDCFVGLCCLPTSGPQPKCRVRTNIEVKSWKRTNENEDQQAKVYGPVSSAFQKIVRSGSTWEERQQMRRNKEQHSTNGNIDREWSVCHDWYDLPDDDIWRMTFRDGTVVDVTVRQSWDIYMNRITELENFIVIPDWMMVYLNRTEIADSIIYGYSRRHELGANRQYYWLGYTRDSLQSTYTTNKRMHALKGNIDKENTKRDSKTHRSQENTRALRLMSKDTKRAYDMICQNRKYVKERRQQAAEKDIMRQLTAIKHLKLGGCLSDDEADSWMNNIKWTVENTDAVADSGEWVDLLKGLVESFPDEIKSICNWVDVICACDVIARVPYVSAKIFAAQALYRVFQYKGLVLGVFLQSVATIYNFIVGYKEDMPQKHMHIESALNAITTLIFGLVFQRKANQNHIDACLSTLRQVTPTSKGLDYIVEAVKTCIKWCKGANDFDLKTEIEKIEKRVAYYSTIQGHKDMRLLQSAYMEITELEIKSMMILKYLPAHSEERVQYSGVAARLNSFYKAIQTAPPSGHGNRKPPVTLHLYGKAGVGKTHLVNLISADAIRVILQLEGMEGDDLYTACSEFEKYMYYNPVANKYKTNYNPAMSKVFVCDDANQVNPHFLKEGHPFPVDIIHYANSHTHLLNVAELENKANANFNSPLIIATDNAKRPPLDYMASKEAYERRIDLQYKVEVHPEYMHRSRGVNVVNPESIDLGEANVHIYKFTRDDNTVITYDQLKDEVIAALIKKHETFKKSCNTFRTYATRGLPVPVELQHQGSNRLHEPQAEVVATKAGFCSAVGDGLMYLPRKAFNVAKSIRTLTLEDIYYGLGPPPGSEPINYVCWHISYYWYLLHYTPFWQHPFLTTYYFFIINPFKFIKRFFFSTPKRTRRSVKILSALGLIIAGVYTYRQWSKKKKKRIVSITTKKQHSEEEVTEQAYGAGNPSTARNKPGPPPNTRVVSRPLYKQGETAQKAGKCETFKMVDFANSDTTSAEKEVASGLSYVMAKVMCSNAYLIQFIDNTGSARTLRGFFVKGGLFIVNMHLLEGIDYEQFIKGYFNLYNVFETVRNISAKKVDIYQIMHEGSDDRYYDIIAIDFKSSVRVHADMTKAAGHDAHRPTFVKAANVGDISGSKIMVMTVTINAQFDDAKELTVTDKVAWYVELQHTHVSEVSAEPLEAKGPTGIADYTYRVMQYNMQSVPGYCGSVIIGNTPDFAGCIFGIHMAGYTCNDRSFGQIVTYEMIESLNLQKHVSFSQTSLKSSVTLLDNTFNRVGNIPHQLRSSSKSKIYPSIFHNKIFKTTKKPANLGLLPSGEHVINKALKKYLEPSTSISEEQASVFYGCLMHQFGATRKIRQLTHKESISGRENDEYVAGINRSSSAGYPFNKHTNGKKGKEAFLGTGDEWKYDDPMLLEYMKEYKDNAENNIRPECYFVSTAKDELRPIEKVDAGKTRSFAAAPLHYVVLFRQYFLDLFANIMENKVYNSSLVGINPYSAEWDVLVHKLTTMAHPKSKQFIATDFTNWDGTLNRDLLWIIFKVIEAQYNRNDPVSRALWQDIVTSQQVFGNVIIQVMRGQPSGNPGTAIINTMYNYGITYLCIYDMLADIYTQEAFDCIENLHKLFYVAIYGDDSVISFKAQLCKLLDITKWAQYMEKYGHHCTPETKDGGEIEFKTLDEISIIKRRFVFDNELKIWLAPLDLGSILEPLNWDRCDQVYEIKSEQMYTNARLAIRELSLHPKDIFESYRDKILTQCMKHRIVLPPDCYYDQKTLRKMVRTSDNIFYLVNDDLAITPHSSIFEDIESDEDWDEHSDVASLELTPQKHSGRCIYIGGRHVSSPHKESHPSTSSKHYSAL